MLTPTPPHRHSREGGRERSDRRSKSTQHNPGPHRMPTTSTRALLMPSERPQYPARSHSTLHTNPLSKGDSLPRPQPLHPHRRKSSLPKIPLRRGTALRRVQRSKAGGCLRRSGILAASQQHPPSAPEERPPPSKGDLAVLDVSYQVRQRSHDFSTLPLLGRACPRTRREEDRGEVDYTDANQYYAPGCGTTE